jgi:hypothetical protein
MEDGSRPTTAQALRALRMVFWAFFGIRKGIASEHDLASIRPWHLVVAALLGAALFVATIVTLVHFIIG